MHLLTQFGRRRLGQEFPQSVQRTRLGGARVACAVLELHKVALGQPQLYIFGLGMNLYSVLSSLWCGSYEFCSEVGISVCPLVA